MSAHTPGPWRYDYEVGYCGEIVASNGQTICTFNDEPLPSHARLIAAAPELLEALIDLVALYPLDSTDAIITSARAAISKATGGEA